MSRTVYLALLALLVLPLAQAAAMPITIGAAADGYGKGPGPGGDSDNVMDAGVGTSLSIRNGNATLNVSRKTYIRFDLSTAIGDGALNFGAPTTLHLQRGTGASPGSANISVYGLNTGFVPSGSVLDTDWVETALTWNNGPANNTSSGHLLNPGEAGLITTFAFDHVNPAGATYEITLGSLAPYLQADNTVTFILTGPVSDTTRMYLASREDLSLDGPQLTFELVPPVPEPGSCTLLGLGALMLMRTTRRRKLKATA